MGIKTRMASRGLTLGVLLAIAPASAFAVSVSSDDGNGTQYRTESYSNGAKVSGNLRSTAGKPVYYSGKVVINNCGDSVVGRYTTNTTSKSYVTRGGTIASSIGLWPCSFDGVESRICRDINNLPDTCGSWSTKY
jgi:hypothetical protein